VHTKFRRTMLIGAVCAVVLMGGGVSSRGAAGMWAEDHFGCGTRAGFRCSFTMPLAI
jgi:hypothetical protein